MTISRVRGSNHYEIAKQIILSKFSSDSNSKESSIASVPSSLKTRINAIIDLIGYKIYAAFMQPSPFISRKIAEIAEERIEQEILGQRVESFEKIQERVLTYEWEASLQPRERVSWGHNLKMERLNEYGAPDFRKAQAKKYLDNVYERKAVTPEEEYLTLSFCQKEIQALYRENSKYLKGVSEANHHLFPFFVIDIHNVALDLSNRKNWENFSITEKIGKIFNCTLKYQMIVAVGAFGFFCVGWIKRSPTYRFMKSSLKYMRKRDKVILVVTLTLWMIFLWTAVNLNRNDFREFKENDPFQKYLEIKNQTLRDTIFPALLEHSDLTKEEKKELQEEFELHCPITCDYMEKPVKAGDGRVYEEKALYEWLTRMRYASQWENSPIKAGHIDQDSCIPLFNYYEKLFQKILDRVINAREKKFSDSCNE